MNNHKQCLTDEMIVDSLLAKLPVEQMEEIERHLQACARCQRSRNEWMTLLQAQSQPGVDKEIATALPRIHKRLKKTIGLHKRRPTPLWRKPAVVILTLCLFIGLSFAKGWHVNQEIYQETSQHQSHVFREAEFLIDPQTVHYRIGMANNPHSRQSGLLAYDVNGNLWINHTSQEVIIFLEGLRPLADRDYQVWISAGQRENNAGVVEMDSGKGYIYWSGEDSTQIEFIRISIEPKGGSQVPTGPEALFIPLYQYHTR
ncbi:hypothetical protein GCM10010965_00650 [Caldalkalibacillus thermarum]|uniref:anti-sigma factor n=1 Tax=Caldalkalibacillus thermarum TaxID=296745 RepID=UPI001667A6CC|nr:anti-sigma factor [Caldalkalibacillus thermarum]GGK11603.1 hypothetical protein GCM10010965_00650 [Caldalkalibacillus thermarum]